MSVQLDFSKYTEILDKVENEYGLGFIIGVCSEKIPHFGDNQPFDEAEIRYLRIGWKDKIEWEHNPLKANRFKTFQDAKTLLSKELEKPPKNIQGIMYPSLIYTSGLNMGLNKKQRAGGIFFIKRLVLSEPMFKISVEQEYTIAPKQ